MSEQGKNRSLFSTVYTNDFNHIVEFNALNNFCILSLNYLLYISLL